MHFPHRQGFGRDDGLRGPMHFPHRQGFERLPTRCRSRPGGGPMHFPHRQGFEQTTAVVTLNCAPCPMHFPHRQGFEHLHAFRFGRVSAVRCTFPIGRGSSFLRLLATFAPQPVRCTFPIGRGSSSKPDWVPDRNCAWSDALSPSAGVRASIVSRAYSPWPMSDALSPSAGVRALSNPGLSFQRVTARFSSGNPCPLFGCQRTAGIPPRRKPKTKTLACALQQVLRRISVLVVGLPARRAFAVDLFLRV